MGFSCANTKGKNAAQAVVDMRIENETASGILFWAYLAKLGYTREMNQHCFRISIFQQPNPLWQPPSFNQKRPSEK